MAVFFFFFQSGECLWPSVYMITRFLYITNLQVQNCYRISKDASLGTKTPTPKQKDVRPRQSQNSGLLSSKTVEEAAKAAAYNVAEAENKSFLAAEAVKEAERVSKLAEDTDSTLQLVKEIYEQCKYQNSFHLYIHSYSPILIF